MPVEHRFFDPDGDVLLRLQDPSDGDDVLDNGELALADTFSSTSILESASPASTTNSDVVFTPTSTSTEYASSVRTRQSIHMVVSSRHLSLASPVFRTMLQSRGLPNRMTSRSRTEITLPDDDPAALEILLDIIHGHVSRVREEIDLETLIELSVLIDKYQVCQVMDLYIKMWMENRRYEIPRSYTSDTMAWLSIAWVFKLRQEYMDVSKTAQQGSMSRMSNNGRRHLPVPNFVLDEIEAGRQLGLSRLIASVNKMLRKYMAGTTICEFNTDGGEEDKKACDGLMLGSLIQGLIRCDLWPLPTAPYNGLSVEETARDIQELELMAVCDKDRFYTLDTPFLPGHGWMKKFKDDARKVLRDIDGLDLVIPNT